jgi:hypothetical protein
LYARLPVLLKLQRIVLNGQYSGAVSSRVCESQQMSRPSAEWCARVPSLFYFLRWGNQTAAKQDSREPQSVVLA